ncbi:MAG TPA: DUF4127 family protein [Candidatus Cybelea sp.]|nr:DUF4127 family protein [Candidatus Cybelea sp.]
MNVFALLLTSVLFLPMDDRPVTYSLPLMLGRIAGVKVSAPPPVLAGNFLQAGRPDASIAWLNARAASDRPAAFVISTDMLAYGGLVPSRVSGVSYADAYSRFREFAHLRREYPNSWVGAFGTVMRLAPTGIPAGTPYFAAYPAWSYLQAYANLHDPPLASERATAQQLRATIGDATLDAYLATRARNLAVDRLLLKLTANGTIDRLVLGQDDAGPVGLHVRDVALLQTELEAQNLAQRASIEPGADELGMALVANALARTAHWTPRIAVRYSTPAGALYQDKIEYAPISTAIDALVAVCGGVRDDTSPDIVLYVRVPGTTEPLDEALRAQMQADAQTRSVALADLSFLTSYADQARFAKQLLSSGLASRLDAYASWNTNANTTGTALAEAIAAGVGRRLHTYNGLAHRTFTLTRFVDDYAFHDEVRPRLNATLQAQGVADHTLLTPEVAQPVASLDRTLLWNDAAQILGQLYPGYHIAAIEIGLPWSRTFETSLDIAIAPNL